MENFILLLIGVGVIAAVFALFVARGRAQRRPIEPLLEKPPMLDTAAIAPKNLSALDPAVVVAIAFTVNANLPGARIIRVEEQIR